MTPSAISLNVSATFDTSLPVLPHNLGVPAKHRFLASSGVTADASTGVVSSWRDLDGKLTLAAKSGGGGTLGTAVNRPAIRYAARANNGLSASLAMSRPHSAAVAVWIGAMPTTEAATILGGRDAWMRLDPDNGLIGSATTPNGGFGAMTTGWHVFVASFGATTTTVRLNGVETTRDIGNAARTTLHLGTENNGAFPLSGGYGEVVLWDRELTQAERTTVETAMRAVWV